MAGGEELAVESCSNSFQLLALPHPAQPEPNRQKNLTAETRWRRDSAEKNKSKPEGAEIAEAAEKSNFCQSRHEFDWALTVKTPTSRYVRRVHAGACAES